ncbi:MAG: ATP-binding protein [Patescibacteria group bacterium]|nr:ATP-binding protein [Patescibacteria group bacterium]
MTNDKKWKYKVDIDRFVEQLGAEHNALKELITNALEACSKHVRVQSDDINGIISIYNDGMTLNENQLEKYLLTGMSTGDEKDITLNRGVGFVSVFRVSKETIVETGDLKLVIKDHKNIDDPVQNGFVDGFKVTIKLKDEFKSEFSTQEIEKLLDSWVIYDHRKVYLNRKKVCQYLRKSLDVQTYKSTWGESNYCYDQNHFQQEFVVLLKLTNVNAYRILNIDKNLDSIKSNNLIQELVVVCTNSEILNTSRNGFTDYGRWHVEELVKNINKDLSKRELSNKALSYGRSTLKLFRERLGYIRKKLDFPTDIFVKAMDVFQYQLTDNQTIDPINYEIQYFNHFIEVLLSSSLKANLDELEVISLYEIYDKHALHLKLKELNDPNDFSDWFEKRFGFVQHKFFYHEVIGLLVDNGSITGEARLFHLLSEDYSEFSRWINFSQDLFVSGLIENQSLIILINPLHLYYARFPTETESWTLEEKQKVIIDVSTEVKDQFRLMKQQAEEKIPKYSEPDDDFSIEKEKEGYPDQEINGHEDDEKDDEKFFGVLKQFMPKEQASKISHQLTLKHLNDEELISENGTRILCLVDKKSRKRFNQIKNSPQLIERVAKGYVAWKKVMKLVIRNFSEEPNKLLTYIIPAVNFAHDEESKGCTIKDIVAISESAIPKIFDPPLAKKLKFVKFACHEIAHLYVSNHSTKFSVIDSTIFYATANDKSSMKELNKIFKRQKR